MKVGLLFSGQGAQSVGMAKTLYDNYGSVKELFQCADDTLGFKLSRYCFEGPISDLTKTSICQPALYVHGIAVVQVLKERGMLGDISAALGLSLGELTAHAIAGTYTFEDGLKIVAERGRLMQEACDAERGAMASLIGGTVEKVQEYCAEFDIDMSNLNCPGQIVISGAADNVARAVDAAKERKDFKMVVPLKVAGAYHSRLMKPARDAFANFIDPFEFGVPNVAVFTNVTGGRVSEPADIKVNLVKQITSTVRWEDCVNNAAKLGIDQFFECGPGGVLAGMMRRINKDYSIRSFAEISDFD